MNVTRKQDEFFSQQEKQSVAIRQAMYYGLFIYADEVLGMKFFDRVVRRRGKSSERGTGDWNFLLVRLVVRK